MKAFHPEVQDYQITDSSNQVQPHTPQVLVMPGIMPGVMPGMHINTEPAMPDGQIKTEHDWEIQKNFESTSGSGASPRSSPARSPSPTHSHKSSSSASTNHRQDNEGSKDHMRLPVFPTSYPIPARVKPPANLDEWYKCHS